MKKVSIIIPVYNQESMLDTCLSSVCNQTYTNIEIVIINDGSTDSSEQIIKNWMKHENRIVYKITDNHGVSAARNEGIRMSTGDYLMFVDSDDFVNEEIIEKMVRANESCEHDMVVCGLVEYNNEKCEEKHSPLAGGEINLSQYIYELSEYNIDIFFGGPYCKLFLKTSFRKWNIWFENGQSIGEDFVFNMNVLLHEPSIYSLDECLYYYRVDNSGSLSKKSYEAKYYVGRYKEIYNIFSDVLALNRQLPFREDKLKRLFLRILRLSTMNVAFDNSIGIIQKCKDLASVREELKMYECSLDKFPMSLKEKIVVFLLEKRLFGLLIIVYKISAFKTLLRK